MNDKMMQIALIHAPLLSRAKIKQPSNLQNCKRNIAQTTSYANLWIKQYWYLSLMIRNNLRFWRHDFFWVVFVDASKIKLLVFAYSRSATVMRGASWRVQSREVTKLMATARLKMKDACILCNAIEIFWQKKKKDRKMKTF
jgi:hypothetical protein